MKERGRNNFPSGFIVSRGVRERETINQLLISVHPKMGKSSLSTMRRKLVLCFCLPLFTGLAVFGGGPDEARSKIDVPGESKALVSRLKFARKLAAAGKWPEVVETYERLLRDEGDSLVPMEAPVDAVASSTRLLQLRRLLHQEIAALPPAGLAVYRRRVQAQTREWLDEGRQNRDPAPLLRLVDEAFCARVGDQALDLLGDLAFERGDFAQARQWWSLLTADGGSLRFPQSKVDPALTQAKIILALLFDGRLRAARAAWRSYQKAYPDAAGHLAGQDGRYRDILALWISKGLPDFGREQSWPTFAGSPERNRRVQTLPDRQLWVTGPTWRRQFPGRVARAVGSAGTPPARSELARKLMFYPVVQGNRLLLADRRSVYLLDLLTGKDLDRYSLPEEARGEHPRPVRPMAMRYSLTLSGGKVYALLGAREFGPPQDGKHTAAKSCVVCLDIQDDNRLTRRWQTTARDDKSEAVVFAAAPLVWDQRVYVPVLGVRGFQFTTSLLCLHASTGAVLWQKNMAIVQAGEESDTAVVQEPALTLAGNHVVCCTHTGLVIALDSRTGKCHWAVRYPSRGPMTEGALSPRDLAPCLSTEGRVLAAPMDCDRLLCLDSETGETLWERNRLQVVHLLGCARGKVIFTTPQGLRALDVATGSDQNGWLQPEFGRLPPFGRGFLADGWIFWPTQDANLPLRLVHTSDGRQEHGTRAFPPNQLRGLVAGNMAYANGCLVVAGADDIIGYVRPRVGDSR
jgi:outer membrane protein assembly factor BamB